MRGRRRTGGGLSGEPEYGFGTPTAELPMGGAPERSPSSSEDEYDGPVSDRAHAIMRLPTAPSTREMDEAEMAEAELDDDDEEEAEAVKILMLGDSGVGKTCCMHSFVDGKFASTLMATAGVEFQMKTIRVRTRKHRRKVSLQIWDTAGQERFQKITRAFYKNTHGVVFMYDTCDHKSFDSLQRWVDAMQAEIASTTGMQTILIGNKIDLPNREVRFSFSFHFRSFVAQRQFAAIAVIAR
jgi:small GTP-binding protein